MANWIVKIENQDKALGTFDTCESGVKMALRSILDRFPNIPDIVSDVLAQNANRKTSAAIIKPFLDFANIGESDIPGLVYDFCESKNTSKFKGVNFTGSIDFPVFHEFNFGNGELCVETNIWSVNDESSYFIRVITRNDEIKCYVNKSVSDVANIFLVYKALSEIPQSRAEIQATIIDEYGLSRNGYDISLSNDTISNQIKALKYLGIPIYRRSISIEDKEEQASLISIYGDKYKDGYYIDNDRPLTPDYSKLKPGSYIMLVYLTLKEIDRAHALPTQQAVIDAVRDKFGIKLQRQKVKKYIDVLNELGAGVKHDNVGYWMKE